MGPVVAAGLGCKFAVFRRIDQSSLPIECIFPLAADSPSFCLEKELYKDIVSATPPPLRAEFLLEWAGDLVA